MKKVFRPSEEMSARITALSSIFCAPGKYCDNQLDDQIENLFYIFDACAQELAQCGEPIKTANARIYLQAHNTEAQPLKLKLVEKAYFLLDTRILSIHEMHILTSFGFYQTDEDSAKPTELLKVALHAVNKVKALA